MKTSKRRRRRAATVGLLPDDHDGILDVLANLVGVLTLVGALTAILAANSAIKVKTPLAKETNKEFVMIQVGQEGVWDLQSAKERMLSLDRQRVNGWKQCLNLALYDMIYCVNNMEGWSASERVGQVQVRVSRDGASIARLPVPTVATGEIAKADNWLRQELQKAKEQRKAIFIILEKEGFANFRAVRSMAAEYNIELGWEPWETAGPVFFGGNGRSMNVQ